MERKKLENLEKSIVQSNNRKISFDFGQLITKNPIRWEIWSVLRFYPELNINQISQFLKQSRYTISRHLKLMEKDGMLTSREIQPKKRGKYAPKYYKVNLRMSGPGLEDSNNIDEYMDAVFEYWQIPEDPHDKLEFYHDIIRETKTIIINYGKSIEGMHFLFDHLKESIIGITEPNNNNLKSADNIFKKYLSGNKEPFFLGMTFDKEHFKKFREIHKEYWRQIFLLNIDQLKNPDPEGAYFGLMTIVFPSRAILDLKKELFSDK
jgi:DNA-binding transcriptional ArsR family regulator